MANKPKLIPLTIHGITGSITIVENGSYDVRHIANVVVNVPTSDPTPAPPTPSDEPVGVEETVNVIKWSEFQTLVESESAVTDQIYSIEL